MTGKKQSICLIANITGKNRSSLTQPAKLDGSLRRWVNSYRLSRWSWKALIDIECRIVEVLTNFLNTEAEKFS